MKIPILIALCLALCACNDDPKPPALVDPPELVKLPQATQVAALYADAIKTFGYCVVAAIFLHRIMPSEININYTRKKP